MTFHVERFATAWAEAEPLTRANFEEMRGDGQEPFQPQTGLYEYLEACGQLRLYVARVEGEIVGYRVLALAKHPHTSQLVARNDALYLAPSHRAQHARSFLRWTEQQLQTDGVTIVYQSHKPGVRDLDRFLRATGYRPVEITYSRHLGD